MKKVFNKVFNKFKNVNLKRDSPNNEENWLKIFESEKDLYSEVTYFTCLKLLSETLAKMPLKLYQKRNNDVYLADDTDVSFKLKYKPNDLMTPTMFWATIENNRNHYGNAYVWIRQEYTPKKYGGNLKIKDFWIMDSFFKCEETEDICPKDIVEFLKDLENHETIEIHINSGGGSVFGGLAIYNQLKNYKGKKIVYIDGLAGSIASVIALVGDVLYIYKNSMMMIHNPLTAICGYYNAKDLQEQIQALEKCKKSILNVYMANINMAKIIPKEDISKLMDNETWLVGEEITEYFKGYILEDKKEMVACVSNYFDSYKNTPKNIKKIENKPTNNSLEQEKQKILNDLEKISIF